MPAAAAPPDISRPSIVPPPAGTYREGDRWDSGSGPVFIKQNGKWAPYDSRAPAARPFDRAFSGRDDDGFTPAGSTDEGSFTASPSGLLFRFVSGGWKPVPVGTMITAKDGTAFQLDERVTAYDAAQLSELFSGGSALPAVPDQPAVVAPPPGKPLPDTVQQADAAAADNAATPPADNRQDGDQPPAHARRWWMWPLMIAVALVVAVMMGLVPLGRRASQGDRHDGKPEDDIRG